MKLRSTALALTIAGCFGLAAPAMAQRDLSTSITESGSLSDANRAEIKSFLESVVPQLTGEPIEVRAARERIIRQLRTGGTPSIAFRIEYGKQLLPGLEPLIAHEQELVAANALNIAGEIGIPASGPLLAKGLTDKREAVRYAAAFGYKRLFERLIAGSPALTSKQADDALTVVSRAVEAEAEPRVLEGLIRALEAASKVPAAQIKDLRASAVSALARQVGAKAAGAAKDGPDLSRPLMRASQVAHDALTRVHMDKSEPQLPAQSLIDVGGLTGDILSYVRNRISTAGAGLAAEERERLIALTKSAESVYHFALEALGGSGTQHRLGELLDSGSDEEFSKAVADRLIGPPGALTAAPFGFKDDRFIR